MSPTGPFSERIPLELLKKVAEVVPHLELAEIRLIALSAALTAAPPDPPIAVTLDRSVDCKEFDGNYFPVQVKFMVNAAGADDQIEFLNIVTIYQLLYEGTNLSTLPSDKLRAFADVNSVHNCWPYLRELVQDVTGKMGLTRMTLPLLKVLQNSGPEPTDGE